MMLFSRLNAGLKNISDTSWRLTNSWLTSADGVVNIMMGPKALTTYFKQVHRSTKLCKIHQMKLITDRHLTVTNQGSIP